MVGKLVFISSFTSFLLELMFPSKPVIEYWLLREKMRNITREAVPSHSLSLTLLPRESEI
jgi:hypothetical protein